MRMFIALLMLSFSALGQSELDTRLQGYIEEFGLDPQRAPALKNRKLLVLGRRLFFETALSGNKNISCADCHHPRVMTHDGLPLAVGEGAFGIEAPPQFRRMQGTGKIQARNTPALFNLHNVNRMFWDGRVELDPETGALTTPVELPPEVAKTLKSALATQALFPIVNSEEMRGAPGSNPIADAKSEAQAWELIVERLLADPSYETVFRDLFPGEKINIGHVGEAIGAFEAEAFFFVDTPYDRYLKGKLNALTEKQKLGMDIFFSKGQCGNCHNGELLSAMDFDSIGVPQIGPGNHDGDDLGRYQWDPQEENRYKFRVPPLRNVALTAPYMHNGAFQTLAEVVEHYDDVAASLRSYRFLRSLLNYAAPITDHDPSKNLLRLDSLTDDLARRLHFTPSEEEALVEFLEVGLTDVGLRR